VEAGGDPIGQGHVGADQCVAVALAVALWMATGRGRA
jgi:hypothetical protein